MVCRSTRFRTAKICPPKNGRTVFVHVWNVKRENKDQKGQHRRMKKVEFVSYLPLVLKSCQAKVLFSQVEIGNILLFFSTATPSTTNTGGHEEPRLLIWAHLTRTSASQVTLMTKRTPAAPFSAFEHTRLLDCDFQSAWWSSTCESDPEKHSEPKKRTCLLRHATLSPKKW